MKVLWLTQLPYTQLPYTKEPKGHPVPWITSLAKPLAKEVQLTIVSSNAKLSNDEEINIDGIRYMFYKVHRASINLLSNNRLNAKIIREHLKKEIADHDIMHIHGSEGMYQQACWDLPIPKVLSVQGIIEEYYPYLQEYFSDRRILWQVIRNAERNYLPAIKDFMCRTEWDKAWVKKTSPKAKIHHCWEALREDFFDTEIHPRHNKSIIFIGGCDYIKGYREALKAVNKALKMAPDIKIIFISGGQKDRSQIMEYIKIHKLTKLNEANLIFRNRLNSAELIEQYKSCFCLLHPSHIDNSPNTICEAQVLGLPVIASEVGGVSSLIRHEETGLLSSLDTDELARAIVDLYSNRNKQRYLSEQARSEARKRHHTPSIVKDTLAIYQSVSHRQLATTLS